MSWVSDLLGVDVDTKEGPQVGPEIRIDNPLKNIDVSAATSLLLGGPLGYAAHQGAFGEVAQGAVRNVTGEITGENFKRQQAWQQQVRQEAEAEQARLLRERLAEQERMDIAASRAAGSIRGRSTGRGQIGLFWDQPQADITDFLGL